MLQIKPPEQKQTDRSIVDTLWNWRAEVLWALATVVLLVAFVGPETVAGLALATVTGTATWWTYRDVERRARRSTAKSASATHLRPAPANRPGLTRTPAQTPWHGDNAA